MERARAFLTRDSVTGVPGALDEHPDHLFDEQGLGPGASLAADFLLVDKEGQDRAGRILHGKDGLEGSVGAGPVVLAVSPDQAAVQTHVPGLHGGDKLQFCAGEVFFHQAVFFGGEAP